MGIKYNDEISVERLKADLDEALQQLRDVLVSIKFRNESAVTFMNFCAQYPPAWRNYRQLCEFLYEIIDKRGNAGADDLRVLVSDYGIPPSQLVTCMRIFKKYFASGKAAEFLDAVKDISEREIPVGDIANNDELSALIYEVCEIKSQLRDLFFAAEYDERGHDFTKINAVIDRQIFYSRIASLIALDSEISADSESALTQFVESTGLGRSYAAEHVAAFKREYGVVN